jgi:hypothetical protein
MNKKNEEKRYILISPFLGFSGRETSLLDKESLLKIYYFAECAHESEISSKKLKTIQFTVAEVITSIDGESIQSLVDREYKMLKDEAAIEYAKHKADQRALKEKKEYEQYQRLLQKYEGITQ